MDFPVKLVDRDPRNREHLQQAYQLMKEVGEIAITRHTADELNKAGLEYQNVTVTDEIPDDTIIVGAFYFLEQGLMFRDNHIKKCADCKHALQIRPHVRTIKTILLCCFCATDRALAEYHAEKDIPNE